MNAQFSNRRDTRRPPLWPLAYLAVLAFPVAVAALVTYWTTYQPLLFGDADWYATALPALTSDAPLYAPEKLLPHPLQRPPFFDQAPSTALFASLLLLPGGKVVWGLTMAAAVVVGLALIWPRAGLPATLLLAPVVLVFFPVTSALAWANINSLVFMLLAVAWRFPRVAGWAIGVAAAAKLVPILGVFWLIGRRDWRAAAIAVGIPIAATLAIVLWKGPSTLSDFIVLRANQWVPESELRWGIVEATGLPAAITMGLGMFVGITAAAKRSLGLAIVAMLVAIPAMHAHYLTWLLVPLVGWWLPGSRGYRANEAPASQLTGSLSLLNTPGHVRSRRNSRTSMTR